MLQVVAVGRLTRDPEVRTANSGKQYAQFTVASDRRYSSDGGEKKADFLNAVIFGKSADFVGQYLKKGSLVCATGDLQIGKYTDKEGVARTKVELVCSHVDSLGSKASQNNAPAQPTQESAEPAAAGSSSEFDPWAQM